MMMIVMMSKAASLLASCPYFSAKIRMKIMRMMMTMRVIVMTMSKAALLLVSCHYSSALLGSA